MEQAQPAQRGAKSSLAADISDQLGAFGFGR